MAPNLLLYIRSSEKVTYLHTKKKRKKSDNLITDIIRNYRSQLLIDIDTIQCTKLLIFLMIKSINSINICIFPCIHGGRQDGLTLCSKG